MTKIAVLIGTRPGIIKMSPLVHEAETCGLQPVVIHTGQHYSENMDQVIRSDVGLEEPDFVIIRPENCITHAEQTAYMLVEIEKALTESKPDIILVCGDANTNLAGALAARKLHISVGHVEAGLRSFDWRMPEEHNRVMIDHISDYLFAPTDQAKVHLVDEKVKGKVFVVGNTIVDSTLEYSAQVSPRHMERIRRLAGDRNYVLVTSHREENVDNKEILGNIVTALQGISETGKLNIVFPLHPRTRKRLVEFGLYDELLNMPRLSVIEPLSYKEFLAFIKQASMIITDSGGLQEESCILNVPCITIRESTERPETVELGANTIVGTNPTKILEAVENILRGKTNYWQNPYGDGKAAERIIDTCLFGEPKTEFLFSENNYKPISL